VGRWYWRRYSYCNEGFMEDQLIGDKVRIQHSGDCLSESSAVDMMDNTVHIVFISIGLHKAYFWL
jgi:hypothetical protein